MELHVTRHALADLVVNISAATAPLSFKVIPFRYELEDKKLRSFIDKEAKNLVIY